MNHENTPNSLHWIYSISNLEIDTTLLKNNLLELNHVAFRDYSEKQRCIEEFIEWIVTLKPEHHKSHAKACLLVWSAVEKWNIVSNEIFHRSLGTQYDWLKTQPHYKKFPITMLRLWSHQGSIQDTKTTEKIVQSLMDKGIDLQAQNQRISDRQTLASIREANRHQDPHISRWLEYSIAKNFALHAPAHPHKGLNPSVKIYEHCNLQPQHYEAILKALLGSASHHPVKSALDQTLMQQPRRLSHDFEEGLRTAYLALPDLRTNLAAQGLLLGWIPPNHPDYTATRERYAEALLQVPLVKAADAHTILRLAKSGGDTCYAMVCKDLNIKKCVATDFKAVVFNDPDWITPSHERNHYPVFEGYIQDGVVEPADVIQKINEVDIRIRAQLLNTWSKLDQTKYPDLFNDIENSIESVRTFHRMAKTWDKTPTENSPHRATWMLHIRTYTGMLLCIGALHHQAQQQEVFRSLTHRAPTMVKLIAELYPDYLETHRSDVKALAYGNDIDAAGRIYLSWLNDLVSPSVMMFQSLQNDAEREQGMAIMEHIESQLQPDKNARPEMFALPNDLAA